MSDPAGLRQLAAMIADIEGFIGRRAAELASQRGPRGVKHPQELASAKPAPS